MYKSDAARYPTIQRSAETTWVTEEPVDIIELSHVHRRRRRATRYRKQSGGRRSIGHQTALCISGRDAPPVPSYPGSTALDGRT